MDEDRIAANPGRRSTAKLMLCALWGKFGQRARLSRTQICTTRAQLYRILLHERYTVTAVHRYPDQARPTLEVVYEDQASVQEELPHGNVYVAAFTTAWARLRLWRVLHALGDRVLYYDTDSIIYRRCRDMPPPPEAQLGDYLGDLTYELGDPQTTWIQEFVSTGPKSYAFRTNHHDVQCKVKGIRKTLYNLQCVNFVRMLECVESMVANPNPLPHDDDDQEHPANSSHAQPKNLQFRLDRFGRVQTLYQCKVFRMVYDKRWIGPQYVTYPWGYAPREHAEAMDTQED